MMPSRGFKPLLDLPALVPLRSANCARQFSTKLSVRRNAVTRSSPSSIPSLLSAQRQSITSKHTVITTTALGLRTKSTWAVFDRAQVADFGKPTEAPILQNIEAQAVEATSAAAAEVPNIAASDPSTSLPTPSTLDASPSADLGLDQSVIDLHDLPEQIGYLRALGLEYGWGPTSTIEWLLEHVHVYAGTPWWASIVLTAVLVRILVFPLFVMVSDASARQAAMAPIVQPMMKKMNEALKRGDNNTFRTYQLEMKKVYKESGLKMMRQFYGPLVQGVLGYGTFTLMRAMARLPVPGFENGGLSWFSDLTIPDPYYIIPTAMALSLHVIGRLGGEAGGAKVLEGNFRLLALYGLPGLMFIFTIWFPAALQISFFVGILFGLVQNRFLRIPAVRSMLKLAPFVKPGATITPRQHISQMARSAPTVIDTTATTQPATNIPAANKPAYGQSATSEPVSSKPTYIPPNKPQQRKLNYAATYEAPLWKRELEERRAKEAAAAAPKPSTPRPRNERRTIWQSAWYYTFGKAAEWWARSTAWIPEWARTASGRPSERAERAMKYEKVRQQALESEREAARRG